jgi:hypothetical protein
MGWPVLWWFIEAMRDGTGKAFAGIPLKIARLRLKLPGGTAKVG